jgi:hypothetical protein
VAYPQLGTANAIHIEIYIRNRWIDITNDVLGQGVSTVNISRYPRERGPGTANISPCTATMTIATADGKYSPLYEAGPYFGYLTNNTPLRIYLTPHWASGPGMDDTDTFARTVASGWGNSNGGNAYTSWYYGGSYVGTDWSVNGTKGIHSVPVANAYRMSALAAPIAADVDVTATMDTTVTSVTGAALEIGGLYARLNTTTWDYYMARTDISTSGTCCACAKSIDACDASLDFAPCSFTAVL